MLLHVRYGWWLIKGLETRYASLFFVAGINQDDNELITLEIIHRYVEILDRYFGNVSRVWVGYGWCMQDHALTCFVLGLWIGFDLQLSKGNLTPVSSIPMLTFSLSFKAYFILDELIIAGEMQETSKKSVLRVITQQDQFEDQEVNEQKSGWRVASNQIPINL